MTDWLEITKRNARSVQTTIGWIYWDPGAVSRLEALGLPGGLGYIAARAAPLGPAGPEAVVAAFGSISPLGIALALDLVEKGTTYADSGVELRQHIEDETERLTTTPWELFGEAASVRFAEEFEPPCEQLLARVDATAGTNYQPASRIR